MRRLLALLSVVLLAACAQLDTGSTSRDSPDISGESSGTLVGGQELVWPQPPQAPRIRFLYSFRDAADLGFSATFFQRLSRFFSGGEAQQMVRPYAIAVAGHRIAVSDPGASALHLFDTRRNKYRRLTTLGDQVLRSPVGVAFGAGRIYIADSVLKKVLVVDLKGRYLFSIDGLQRPTGLAFDPVTNRLYVSDTLSHQIAVFDQDGQALFVFGSRGDNDGAFNFPSHLFIRDDRLYVNDTMNFRVQVFTLDGRPVGVFGTHGQGSGHFAQPKGVAVDSSGHVYVVDALFNRVQIFAVDNPGDVPINTSQDAPLDEGGAARFLLAFGGQGRGHGEFWLPSGMTIYQDRIYVADSYNRRVQVFEFVK